MLGPYAPKRVWKAFHFLLTVFVTLRKRERFCGIPALGPEPFKQCILDLGVSFIKLAQVLATRADFFSEEYLRELKTIHDEVAPMDQVEFKIMFAAAFGANPPFQRFDEQPIASASIGQVHVADLEDGTRVAVKIRRLGITRRVQADIRILRSILGLFKPLFNRYTKHSIEAVIAEFSTMILKEVDLSIEIENLRKFRVAYADSGVRFPEPYARYSTRDALVMSFEQGLRVDDIEGMRLRSIDFSEVMERLIVFYTEQMLVRGFFHADPHPGNLLVRNDGTLCLLDFGMVKRLPRSTRVAMIELVKAANEKDFEMFIAASKRLGVVAAAAPQEQMMELAERMFDIFDNENLNAMDMRMLAFSTLASMKNLPFNLPQDVVYVMRASALIEGLGTGASENFNAVKDVLPILRRNLHRALGAEARLFPTLASEIKGLPLTMRRIKTVLEDLSDGNLQVKVSRETLEYMVEHSRAFLRSLAASALCLAAAFFTLGFHFPYRDETALALFGLGALRLFLTLR